MKKVDDGITIVYNKNINNKSAIDWIIDRYQVSIDKDSNIPNDPINTMAESIFLTCYVAL